jgi:hypothetical protein
LSLKKKNIRSVEIEMFRLAPKSMELPLHDRRGLKYPRRIRFSAMKVISNYAGIMDDYQKPWPERLWKCPYGAKYD